MYGEQIGATLLRKATQTPLVLFVDQKAAQAVRETYRYSDGAGVRRNGRGAFQRTNQTGATTIGRRQISTATRFASDRDAIITRLVGLDELFDLAEPFGRIREAIAEAQRMTAKAA